MKLLLSAYACEPGRGSEPAVGWNWARELARLGHEVWVLTRAANRATIEAAGRDPAVRETKNPRFLYYDLPAWARRWKKGSRGIRLYYLLWQWGAYRLARRIHASERFDRVHHVTFVGIRLPSFMGGLGIPFVFGPVGGGERAPWRLRRGCGWRGRTLEVLRDAANLLVRVDPLMARTFAAAERIYVTSEETRDLVPRRFRDKTRVTLAIGSDGAPGQAPDPASAVAPSGDGDGTLKLLFVGRLVYWKGLHLGLAAFRRLLDGGAEARLVVVGRGPDERRLKRTAARLGLDGRIEWIPRLARDALLAAYPRHDLMLYPSLHDSGAMVVIEAMAAGLPVICLDLGGPGVLIDESCGRAIATAGRDDEATEHALGEALAELAADPALRGRLAQGALRRVRECSWKALALRVYGEERE